MKRWIVVACVAGLLGACDEPTPATPRAEAMPAAAQARPAAAMRVAEERLRTRLRNDGPLTLRALQAHRQAAADALAICGQVNPSGRGDDAFVPFVAVVGFDGERAVRAEFHIAGSSAEATRVYYEMVDRCFDGGGPPVLRGGLRPLPPAPFLPDTVLVQPVMPETPIYTGMQPASLAPPSFAPASTAFGLVTTRNPANIRANPSGGGVVLRVAPRGTRLDVFAEAPGNWVQVGEGEPWGWVHGSMLDR